MLPFEMEAEQFLTRETEFQLGFLPSEARHPLTGHLDRDFAESSETGVKTLLACDRALLPFIRETLARKEFAGLCEAMRQALRNNCRIVFSGCGATGRLSILLETAWREWHPGDEHVLSLMTGGEFALVRAVEHFEDYAAAGRRQAEELALGRGDVLVGITATGETASILGSAREAALRGADVFMLICVPLETAASRLERCRELYSMPEVRVIDMNIGGMALTGSTRMQSSTIETLIAGAALEKAAGIEAVDYEGGFAGLLEGLETSAGNIAEYIDLETAICRRHGLINYLAGEFILDIISDTTERSPTFMTPPFKLEGDALSPEPWAFVKNPDCSTPEAWLRCFRRPPRCLAWSREEYLHMGLPELLKNGVPQISQKELLKIRIGNEFMPQRKDAVEVSIIPQSGGGVMLESGSQQFRVGGKVVCTPLRLFEHLQIKLMMNLISTGTMVRLGRVQSNWMTWLNITNKKLIDRAVRIISSLCGISYRDACYELFKTRAELTSAELSPVQQTILRLKKQQK